MPDTTATSSWLLHPVHGADERVITMPMPHPLHQTLGNFLVCRR
jgi:hypothetical protein